MINFKAQDNNNGLMEQNLKEIIIMDLKMDMDNSFVIMVMFIKVNL